LVYPNPIKDGGKITLLVPVVAGTDLRLEWFTLAFRKVGGLEVHLSSAGGSVLLDLVDKQGRPLANGIYYLVASGGDRHWVVKLMVLR
jgi:hypothetical protein